MRTNFEQLSVGTLDKIKGFGIKSRTVIKFFKRSCRMLKTYLLPCKVQNSNKSTHSKIGVG